MFGGSDAINYGDSGAQPGGLGVIEDPAVNKHQL